MTGTVERLWGIIEPYVAAEGIELDDLEIVGKVPGVVVRVTLDADGGVGVDRMAEISRGLSRVLDEDDPVDGSYTLEVSSPGLERKLKRQRHFEKSIGRAVKVKTGSEIGGSYSHKGILVDAGDNGFVVEVDGDGRSIAYGEVVSARTVFIWEKAVKPGKR